MTKEIRELLEWLEHHQLDFGGHIRLAKLIKEYGDALDKEQDAALWFKV